MSENSTGHGLRSRARRQSTLTREAIEEVLYDKAYSWELVPGSDVMATCVGVLPKIGGADGNVYYAGLITVAEGAAPIPPYIDYGNQISIGFNLLQPTVAMTYAAINSDAGQQYWPAEGHDQVPAGVYLAVWFSVDGGPPPYAFPEGWTPGNTTGSGPVLPYLGAVTGYDVYAGLVDVVETEGVTRPDGWYTDDATHQLTAVHLDHDGSASAPLSGMFMGIYEVATGQPAPTALPAGWTFRPYGLGPIAITDENAGGLIGDVAYVVSGYVYNSDSPGMVRAFGHPTKYLVAEGSIDVEVGDAVYKAGGGGIASQGPGLITVAGTLTAGPDGDVNGGTATWVHYTGGGESDYWPFIERFDLAQKKWLPRVPLPPAASTPDEPAWTYTNWGFSSEGATKVSYDGNNYVLIASTAEVDPTGPHPPSDVPAAWTLLGPTTFTATPYSSEGGIAGVIDGKLYFGGGDSDDITGQEFFVYDPADDSITRLADMEGDGWYADYSAYGVVGGKLWYCNSGASEGGNDMRCYDPATDEWTLVAVTGARTLDYYAPDQVQGFEIDGKLWFVYNGAAFVFDPVALTVAAKAAFTRHDLDNNGTPFLIDGKIHEFSRVSDPSRVYDSASDVWTVRNDQAVVIPTGDICEFVGVTYDGVPYLLDTAQANKAGPLLPGVYGLTGVVLDKPRAARLQDVVDRAPDIDWVDITNDVAPLSDVQAVYNPIRYCRRRGVVYIEGAVGIKADVTQTSLFVLPIGFRPQYGFTIKGSAEAAGGAPQDCELVCGDDGAVRIHHVSGGALTSVDLHVSFSAA